MAFDEKCGKLAAAFLGRENSPEKINELAQHIQDAIEGWFECQGDDEETIGYIQDVRAGVRNPK